MLAVLQQVMMLVIPSPSETKLHVEGQSEVRNEYLCSEKILWNTKTIILVQFMV
jgi:hypothetical protein